MNMATLLKGKEVIDKLNEELLSRSDSLKERLLDAKIHTEIFGSDHCTIELDLKD